MNHSLAEKDVRSTICYKIKGILGTCILPIHNV